MKVCICGGGNLGHVIAGFVSAQHPFEVSVFTRHPERWQQELIVETPEGTALTGKLADVTSDARQAVTGADVVLLCLPGYAIREMLCEIREYLTPSTAVGSVVSSTGFFFVADEVLPPSIPIFGFQRVPFIARIIDYGRHARLMGYKDRLHVAIEHTENKEKTRRTLELMLKTPVSLLQSHYEASLSNSNPLLHPSRLYDLWSDWHEGLFYEREPLFYEEWTERAAQLYIDMDSELQRLLRVLPVRSGSIPTVLDYYESHDAVSLAAKLRSIEAFKGIKAPMRLTAGGYVPDFGSRYFVEDFPYGLSFIHQLMHAKGIPSPTIDRVLAWGLTTRL
ncbi:MAG: NAD/NADP octopine/nopaline dehydrogenase family protein [Prevotella sp.]|jgi:hypothetical protein|nr:NAD/NADP octopine/nopaline dehydrogenase family protein [Prevotella sp.]